MKTAQRIKKRRRELQMTQAQLADAIDIGQASICFYEKGLRKPRTDTLYDLAKALGVSVDYLMGKSDSKGIDERIAEMCAGFPHMPKADQQRIMQVYEFLRSPYHT